MAKTKKSWPRTIQVGSAVVRVYEVRHATSATGKAYVVAYVTPAGRRTKKFADPDRALEEARLQAGNLAAGRVEAAETTVGEREELQAARMLAGDVPLLAALEEWAKARKLTNGELIRAAESWRDRHRAKIERVTVGDAITRYTKAKTALGKDTARTAQTHLKQLRVALGDYAIADVTEAMLTSYLASIEHPVSRNTHRKKLVTLWRWCRLKNLLPKDARTVAEDVERATEPPNEIGVITPAVFGDLLRFTRETLPADLPALVIAGFAGLRRTEVHGQKWSDIDLEDGHLVVTSAKKGTPARRLVKLCPAAVQWLMLAQNKRGMVCDGVALDRVRKAAVEAGFKLPKNCLRHGYISAAVAKSGNVAQVALDSGNSPQIIHAHYRALMRQRDGGTWFETSPTSKRGELVAMKEASA